MVANIRYLFYVQKLKTFAFKMLICYNFNMKMRLDKYLSNAKILTRKETEKQIKYGTIKINGEVATKKDQYICDGDTVTFNDEIVSITKYVYIMLNKPNGYVSSTDDPRDNTVLDLLPDTYRKYDLFPCGRLDKDTVGLMILTNDGTNTHNALSPKNHIEKKYYFELCESVTENDILSIENGVTLKDGLTTKPCKINMTTDKSGYIILTEGKYHEIKRLFASQGNKVCYLKRISFGGILLDNNLKEGEFRLFTDKEINLFTNLKIKNDN